MARTKKMAFGGLGSLLGGGLKQIPQSAAQQAAAKNVAARPPGPMAQGQGPQSQMAAQMAAQMAQQAAAKNVAARLPGPMAQGQGPQSQMAAQMAAQMAQQAAAKNVAARPPGPMAQNQGAMGMGVKAPANALSPMAQTAANVGRMGGAALGKFMKSGGKVSSASSRADGIAQRGKTRGTMVACGGGYIKGKK